MRSMQSDQDNRPTPELVLKLGERYQAPANDQKVKRPHATNMSAIEFMLKRDLITTEEYVYLSKLRSFLLGSRSALSIVASYGDQRWSGTTASQEISDTAPEYRWLTLSNEVRRVEKHINDGDQWGALVLVLGEDEDLLGVGRKLGKKGKEDTVRRYGSSVFKSAVSKVVAYFSGKDNRARQPERSDYVQIRPAPY
jgi:hypothetical protein